MQSRSSRNNTWDLCSKRTTLCLALFLADDSILFARATTEEAVAVKGVIQRYENTSRKMINLEKTEITCSSNVPPEKIKEISECLGVK